MKSSTRADKRPAEVCRVCVAEAEPPAVEGSVFPGASPVMSHTENLGIVRPVGHLECRPLALRSWTAVPYDPAWKTTGLPRTT